MLFCSRVVKLSFLVMVGVSLDCRIEIQQIDNALFLYLQGYNTGAGGEQVYTAVMNAAV